MFSDQYDWRPMLARPYVPRGTSTDVRDVSHAVVTGNLGLRELEDRLRFTERMRDEGQTVMFVAIDARAAGLITVADPIKETTPDALAALHRDRLRIVMLTGDSRTTADAVARTLGIDEVIAEVLPHDKVAAVKRLQKERDKMHRGSDLAGIQFGDKLITIDSQPI